MKGVALTTTANRAYEPIKHGGRLEDEYEQVNSPPESPPGGYVCCVGVCCVVHSALPAPNVTISFSGDSIAGLNYSLHCSASVVAGLVVLPDLKIVSPNSTEVSAVNSSSVDYVFSPLRTSDGGQYTCTATVNIPQVGITELENSAVETITVVGKYTDPTTMS